MEFDSEEEKKLLFGGNDEDSLELDFFPIIDMTIGEEEILLSEDSLAYKRRKLSPSSASPQNESRDLSAEPSKRKRPAPRLPLKTKKLRKSSAKPTTSKVPSLPVSIPLSSVSSAIPKIDKPHDFSEKSSTSKGPTLPPAIPMTGFNSSTPITQKPHDIIKPPTNETKMSDMSLISPLASVYDAQIPSDVNERTGPNSSKQLNGPNLNDSLNRNNNPPEIDNPNRNKNPNMNKIPNRNKNPNRKNNLKRNRNNTRKNGNNSRGWENAVNGGQNTTCGQNNLGRGRNLRSNSSSYNNFSLMTSHKFYNQKNVYKSEGDSVYTLSQAPKALIMKEDLSPYDENEINSLRGLIENAILRDTFDGWAPILEEGSIYCSVACEILCLTTFTASWFLSCDLGKIGDKQLRIIRNGDMPHVDFNTVYHGLHRSPRDFLNILAKQNPDTELNVQSWFVTDLNEQSDGTVWVAVKMSLKSAECLVNIKKRELYFGAQTITFYEC